MAKWQGFRTERWRRAPSFRTNINSGQTTVTVSVAAIQSYSLILRSVKPANHGHGSGSYLMKQDIAVNSIVSGTSFCFPRPSAVGANEVITWELITPDLKVWR